MRKEIAIVAGPKEWGDSRATWLARVPSAIREALGTKKETVSHRTVKSIWYGEISDPEHHAARDLIRAAQLIEQKREAQRDIRALTEKLEAAAGGRNATNANLPGAEIARLELALRILRGEGRA